MKENAMIWKPVFFLIVVLGLFQAPQLRTMAERQNDPATLPQELTETETQSILKERSPRPHVETTLKVSEARLSSAARLVQEEQFKSAATEVSLYSALIRYADAYTRKLPDAQHKDRTHCLKRIEQSIFKQNRTIDAVLRELPLLYRESAEEQIETVKKIRRNAINDVLGGGNVLNPSN